MKAAIMKRLGKEEKGFTLIELLAVIVILAVIAAIAIPLIGNIISKSKTDADVSSARQIYDATRLYVTSELDGVYPKSANITVDTLQKAGYLDKNIALPSTKKALAPSSYLSFDANGDLSGGQLTDTSSKAVVKDYQASEILANEKASSAPPASTPPAAG